MSVQRQSGKYGTIKPRILEWDRHYATLTPDMSNHLLFGHGHQLGRWDKRTTWDSCSPEYAWKHGIDITPLVACGDLMTAGKEPADSAVYYYEETEQGENEVVLIERDGIVTTVLLVDRMSESTQTILKGLRGMLE